jgi:hypothetical protein
MLISHGMTHTTCSKVLKVVKASGVRGWRFVNSLGSLLQQASLLSWAIRSPA